MHWRLSPHHQLVPPLLHFLKSLWNARELSLHLLSQHVCVLWDQIKKFVLSWVSILCRWSRLRMLKRTKPPISMRPYRTASTCDSKKKMPSRQSSSKTASQLPIHLRLHHGHLLYHRAHPTLCQDQHHIHSDVLTAALHSPCFCPVDSPFLPELQPFSSQISSLAKPQAWKSPTHTQEKWSCTFLANSPVAHPPMRIVALKLLLLCMAQGRLQLT